jgi:hypothetical protein
VSVPFVHIYELGVVISPLTLNTAVNVAVPASQSILLGVIVTTASGPVSPRYLDHT